MFNFLYNIKAKFVAWVADIRIYPWPMFFIFAGDSHYKIKLKGTGLMPHCMLVMITLSTCWVKGSQKRISLLLCGVII